jgi:hypothetical protein
MAIAEEDDVGSRMAGSRGVSNCVTNKGKVRFDRNCFYCFLYPTCAIKRPYISKP